MWISLGLAALAVAAIAIRVACVGTSEALMWEETKNDSDPRIDPPGAG